MKLLKETILGPLLLNIISELFVIMDQYGVANHADDNTLMYLEKHLMRLSNR